MPRRKPIKTISDYVQLREKRRKMAVKKVARALRSPDAVCRASNRFSRGLEPDSQVDREAFLKASHHFQELCVEEFEFPNWHRRARSQRNISRGTTKRSYRIGPALSFGFGPHSISYQRTRTFPQFIEEWVRSRLSKGEHDMKALWRDLPSSFRCFAADAEFYEKKSTKPGTVRNQSINLTIAGCAESVSFYAFERIVQQAKKPLSTISDLTPRR